MNSKKTKLISLFLLLVLESNYLLALPSFAQAARTGATPSHPANKTNETLLTESFPTFASVNPSFPVLDTQSRPALDSAFIRTSPIVQKLLKKQYRSGEDISFAIANPQDDSLSVSVVDGKGQQADVAIAHMLTGNGTLYDVSPRAQFRPGKYKLVVTDASGRRSEQDFSWGVLSINSDRSVYLPGQTADLSIAVLDDGGNMVCDAKLDLNITTATASASDVLSTGNGKITVNPQCQSHKFSLSPDYEAHYRVGSAGTYKMSLTAQTKSGSYTISDQLIVQDAVPFDVQRVSATRIYPPNDYPVQLNVTANQDFTGTVTETVPASFTVTSSNTATTSSYTNMQTMYLNQHTDPANKLATNLTNSPITATSPATLASPTVLGASTSALLLPFTGSFQVTEGFGAEQTDPALRLFYEKYGLAGHDGADFGLPVGTPVRSVDDGTIMLAGPGDYGITIVIQHSWGKSYYGHLNQVTVNFGQHVSKGEQIGFSGNTGEATGPHLHFGMKPNTPDLGNGYYGKIDPLPYFNLPSSAQVAYGPAIDAPLALSTVLGASTSAARGNNQLVHDPVTAPQTVLDAVVKPDFRSLSNSLKLQILNTPTTANTEKVKIITWNVSVKKGEKISLGYTFKAPQISPQFYLLGPLRFYDNSASGSGKPVFQETRQWQLAADAVGTPWYDYNWQYRKQITIDHTKVVPTYPTATFMETPDALNAVTGDANKELWNITNGTVTYDTTTILQSGKGSWKFDSTVSNNFAYLLQDNVINASGTRVSAYVKFSDFGTSTHNFIGFVAATEIGVGISSTGVLQVSNNGSPGVAIKTGSTLNTGTVYRIAVAFVITSSTNWTMKVFVNGNLDISATNADATLGTTSPTNMGIGLVDKPGASSVMYMAHVYVDNGTTLDDPGDIRVTAKRPFANGTSNQFTTGIGSNPASPYGSGNAQRENERPLNTANGWSTATITTKQTEEYNTESASTGDVDLTGATLVAEAGWIDAKESTTTHSPVSHIIMNGVATAVTLTTSAALYTNIVMNPVYPAGTGTDIGMDGAYSSPGGVYSLYEAGMLFAYTPTAQTYSNFPVLISLTSDNDLKANAATSSGILFTSSDGQTKLNHEIENYNSGTGELEAWVNVPTLSASADTILYMYYGNASATDQSNKTGVWDSNYVGVWHLHETTGTMNSNSTSTSGINATKASSGHPAASATGQIDGAQQYNNPGTAGSSATDYNTAPDNAALDFGASQNFTVSAWVKSTQSTLTNYWPVIVSKDDAVITRQGYNLALHNASTAPWYFEIYVGGTNWTVAGTSDIADGNWHYLVGKRVGSTIYSNQDGTVANSTSASSGSVSKAIPLEFGTNSGNSNNDNFVGSIDEVKISNVARSDGWINTEYNNQNSPSTFYTVGSTDDIPSGTSVETQIYAPTPHQRMRLGKWFCPPSECSVNPGKQPYML